MNTNANQTQRAAAAGIHSTTIADIEVKGEELSEEQLQFVTGSHNASSYTEWVGGRKDKDADF